MAEDESKKPDRARSGAILATVGIVVIMGLALFIGFWVVPFLATRRVIGKYVFAHNAWYATPAWTIPTLPPWTPSYQLTVREERAPSPSSGVWWGAPPPLSESEEMAIITELGGKARARERLRTYLGSPGFAAPNKLTALYLMSRCGPEAVPILVARLRSSNVETRRIAAFALYAMGRDAADAVSALKDALKDSDNLVRASAEGALYKIRGSEPTPAAPDAPAPPE